jgi:hypothetical protein
MRGERDQKRERNKDGRKDRLIINLDGALWQTPVFKCFLTNIRDTTKQVKVDRKASRFWPPLANSLVFFICNIKLGKYYQSTRVIYYIKFLAVYVNFCAWRNVLDQRFSTGGPQVVPKGSPSWINSTLFYLFMIYLLQILSFSHHNFTSTLE